MPSNRNYHLIIAFSFLISLVFYSSMAASPEKGTASILGVWKVDKVVKIGAWSPVNKDLTPHFAGTQIHFSQNGQCLIEQADMSVSSQWVLEDQLAPNYLPGPDYAVLYYPEKVLEITNQQRTLIPQKWERVVITKRKLTFYSSEKGGRIKYVFRR